MKLLTSIITLVTIAFILFVSSGAPTGCTPDRSTTHDTIVPPPPPPVPDTVTYIKKLEEKFGSSPSRIFSFYYDAQKRVTHIGLRFYYSSNISDSFTTRFFYTGSSTNPYEIIRPAPLKSQPGGPTYYDTLWISYNSSNLPVKDSSTDLVYNNNTNLLVYKPLVRYHSYPNTTTIQTEWYGSFDASNSNLLIRKDTTLLNSVTGTVQKITSRFSNAEHAYGKAENFSVSPYVNPLAKLNISGSIFSVVYSPVRNEILGNSFHPAVWNSNGLAQYIDFINQWIPARFYFAAYAPDGSTLMGSGAVEMNVQVSPWPPRGTYPASLVVSMVNSLPGVTANYFYTYY